MIKKAEMSYISGFSMGDRSVSVSHLQFEDDTMIFCEADIRQIGYLRCIIRCFEMDSGLNINLAKSEIFQAREVRDLKNLVWILGCEIGTLPSSYLGMSMGTNFKSKVVWNPLIERIFGRLDMWKATVLSKGGRLTLIKSTLMSISNYLLSLFTIPVSVANKMESIFRNFLWNDSPVSHHFHIVDWIFICKPVAFGDLGIRKVKLHNRVLLAKWMWRFKNVRDSL